MKLSIIPFVLLIAACFIFTGCGNKTSVNQADVEKIVDDYCKEVARGNYDDAYEKYFNSEFKKDISLKDFSSAHEKRRESTGILLEKNVTMVNKSLNIFTGLREYQLTYELKYKNNTFHEIIKLNDADGKFLIEGTYTSSSSDTLRFMLW